MSGIASVVERVVIDKILTMGGPTESNEKIGWGFAALSFFLAGLGLFFMIWAAYLWLMTNYSQQLALAAAGSLSFLLSILVVSFYALMQAYRCRRLKKVNETIQDTINSLIEIFDQEFNSTVRENPKTAVLVSAFAGFATGEKYI
jgi:hypothetical protein